ncbi:MAG: hypothetical protein M1500_00760 [Candidatus Marsarchaeota archaeon]|nr:hypothetical protein [Candidatus Marsarchaeota archaeon]
MKKSKKANNFLPVQVVSIIVIAAIVVVLLLTVSAGNKPSSGTGNAVGEVNSAVNLTLVLSVSGRSNALYSIPNKSAYVQYPGSMSEWSNLGYSNQQFSTYYALPFANGVFGGNQETSILYNLTVPAAYSNLSIPVGVNTFVMVFANSEGSSAVFNKTYYSQSNYTRVLYYNANNTIVAANSSGSRRMNITFGMADISGIRVAIAYARPIYTNLEEYQVAFIYNNTIVVVNTYGLLGKYNKTYATGIAKHDYSIVSGQTAG